MEVKIIGFKAYDFQNSHGERVQGVSVYVCYPEDGTTGEVATKITISSPDLWQQLKDCVVDASALPGSIVMMHFSNKGKLVKVSPLA
ncbi:MAG: hypothetical protein IKY90_09590 [Oscillospiraceae bacterium]|nr:hypothetical protein [Oscillospiraceae bacterium]